MFDALLRLQLAPIVERLAQMETQLEDLYRRAESFCRIGVCQEVDAASNTCKVSHGELLTPAIRFFNPSAGAQTETRIPTVGEQCLLLNYGGGEGGGQSVALFGLNSDRFPPLSSVASLTSRRYPDGTQSAYDAAGHVMVEQWPHGLQRFSRAGGNKPGRRPFGHDRRRHQCAGRCSRHAAGCVRRSLEWPGGGSPGPSYQHGIRICHDRN